jgi:hypothetical protein
MLAHIVQGLEPGEKLLLQNGSRRPWQPGMQEYARRHLALPGFLFGLLFQLNSPLLFRKRNL